MSHLIPAEAHQKICCGPHYQSNKMFGMCVAEKCMAWKWEAKPVKANDEWKPTKGRCGYIPE